MMEQQIFQLIGLYFVYYIGIPGLIIFMIWMIKRKRDFIKTSIIFREKRKGRSSPLIQEEKKKLKLLQISFVVLLLMAIPLLNLTFYGLQDVNMRRSRDYSSWETVFPGHHDLVEKRIGPSFDAEEVIEKMEEDVRMEKYLEDIRDQIDLDKLVRSPGWITVYQVRRTRAYPERIVINFGYLSPIPITRSLDFVIVEGRAFLEGDNLVVYPMPPS